MAPYQAPKNTDGDQLSEDDDTLDIVRKQLLDVREAIASSGLTESARLKLLDTSAKLLALRNRLERDRELQEDRMVREHPEWIRIKAAMLKVRIPRMPIGWSTACRSGGPAHGDHDRSAATLALTS